MSEPEAALAGGDRQQARNTVLGGRPADLDFRIGWRVLRRCPSGGATIKAARFYSAARFYNTLQEAGNGAM